MISGSNWDLGFLLAILLVQKKPKNDIHLTLFYMNYDLRWNGTCLVSHFDFSLSFFSFRLFFFHTSKTVVKNMLFQYYQYHIFEYSSLSSAVLQEILYFYLVAS